MTTTPTEDEGSITVNDVMGTAVPAAAGGGGQPQLQQPPPLSHNKSQRRSTMPMEDFLKMTQLDESAKSMMLKYDKDGDGSFSKEEVADLIKDLQAQARVNADLAMANKILKRILIGAIVFFFLLVASIFGLSFAVAQLSKDTAVDMSSGAMYVKGSGGNDGNTGVIVATNSRADVFHAESYEFGDCLLVSDFLSIKENVLKGTNVVLQRNSMTGRNITLEQLAATGATMEQDVDSETGDIIFDDEGTICFFLPDKPNNEPYCMTKVGPDHPCSQNGSTRRLQERADAKMGLPSTKQQESTTQENRQLRQKDANDNGEGRQLQWTNSVIACCS
mmetsp:Transcript_56967/g.138789  ORF Transcript_56967/g.138789 Transcript_56967/m.138789 type:complete len:333 (-) Transcript_56967:1450-2448(-)|eukprot:CAMPEP_0113485946 /NCGR_PEP_ID=MMETSP0014_2-20120614/24743_1 /TAXON_ID=2857 /ORGANISM="Nitzschia sp." /LENGTH=332 /DNA_ID=CAMNT_0000379603 /DNA_START=238 /DNA_END=1236 /DNA_ORIENTATION=- /assembly_acc=CAM_ASM_000159